MFFQPSWLCLLEVVPSPRRQGLPSWLWGQGQSEQLELYFREFPTGASIVMGTQGLEKGWELEAC